MSNQIQIRRDSSLIWERTSFKTGFTTSINTATEDNIQFYMTSGSGLTQYAAAIISSNNSGCYFECDAEL